MVEVKLGMKTVDLPYTVRIPGVTEAMFDRLVDEDVKAELINGVMVVHSPTTIRHDDIGGFIRFLMRGYSSRRGLGRVLGPDSLVRLGPGRRFAPDVFFVKQARVPVRWPKQFRGVPDLLLEVLSPSNRDDDLEEKRPAYREAGAGEIWFVDPDYRRVLVDRKRRRGYAEEVITKGRVASAVLEGFWLDAAWLWAEPLPNVMECLEQILRGT
jgi:Uma2 family endonuclease